MQSVAGESPPPLAAGKPGRRPNPRIAQWKRTFYFLRRNLLAMVGLGILLFLVAVAIGSIFYNAPGEKLAFYCGTYAGIGPNSTVPPTGCEQRVCTYPTGNPPPGPNCYPVDPLNPSIIAPTVSFSPLSLGPLPFGSFTAAPANPYFYNLFDGLIKGAPWSLGISAIIVGAGAGIGLTLGALAGYLGGWADEVIMRTTDIFLAIPGLLLLIVILSAAGSEFSGLWGHLELLFIAYIVTDWPIYTRIVRSQVLVTRELKFVEASKAAGARTPRIIGRHIIPNSLYPMFVQMSLDVGTIPLGIAALVFLGFTIFPGTYFPEWGFLTAKSIVPLPSVLSYCQLSPSCVFPWWQFFLPGITLFLYAISVSFFSDGLRDSLDPRLRR